MVQAYIADITESQSATHFCISDVRFANEAQWVKDRGGVVWRIDRPSTVPVRAHRSEQEIYHFTPDAVINNSGTIDQLRQTVAMLIEFSM